MTNGGIVIKWYSVDRLLQNAASSALSRSHTAVNYNTISLYRTSAIFDVVVVVVAASIQTTTQYEYCTQLRNLSTNSSVF